MSKVKRDDPCPCGSGKKYKNCCYKKSYIEIKPTKKDVIFSLNREEKISKQITSLDSIPTHNKNGLTPKISPIQLMDLCLDEIEKYLQREKVGMLHDLVDKVVKEMDVIPTFTYRQIGQRIQKDGRFEILNMQICSLIGDDPLELLSKKLGI
jgi:hypothetical protein